MKIWFDFILLISCRKSLSSFLGIAFVFISSATWSESGNHKSFLLLKGHEYIQHVASQKACIVYLYWFLGHDTGGYTALLQSRVWCAETICAFRNDRNAEGQNPRLVERRLWCCLFPELWKTDQVFQLFFSHRTFSHHKKC